MRLPPLALYVHIPWCVRKCPYCDFNSHEAANIPESEYTRALIRDLKQSLEYVQGRKLQSIFFGGGTPSLFSPDTIGRILQQAEQLIGFVDNIEITLEANPGTVEQERFRGYRVAGVNRLSIGIQSFNDQQLQNLGRIHDRQSAISAATSAREAGFSNVNLDLMHGLPGQSKQNALNDLEQALALNPTHLSWYQLTIEPNTAFYKQPPPLPDDDTLSDIQEAGQQLLTEHGFKQYEVSAYCLAGKQSQHNLNYWQFGDYLGIGAGAHGKISQPEQSRYIRVSKTRLPEDYLNRQKSYIARQNVVAATEIPLEFFMNALRLVDGVPTSYFESRTGLDFSLCEASWQNLVSKGLLQPGKNRLVTTDLGFRFLNTVLAFLSEQAEPANLIG